MFLLPPSSPHEPLVDHAASPMVKMLSVIVAILRLGQQPKPSEPHKGCTHESEEFGVPRMLGNIQFAIKISQSYQKSPLEDEDKAV